MATTKSPAGKTPASAPKKAVTKVTPEGGKQAASKAETAVKTKVAAKTAPKTAPKAAPQESTAKTAHPRSRKPAGIPQEQRRHYVEVAAYHIAERRGFTVGNPLEDWVQAEAEIDRLLAEGRLGA